jgi:hypothetical protein
MPPYHFMPYGHKKHERSVRVPNENHPRERWERMRAWAVANLKTPNVADEAGQTAAP